MKTISTLIALVAIACALPLLAGEEKTATSADKSMKAKGTITMWNHDMMSFTIADKKGTSWSFKWNDKTMMTGMPKVGETVRVEYTKDGMGTAWATHVQMMKEEAAEETSHPR
jgi:hypothetical protein